MIPFLGVVFGSIQGVVQGTEQAIATAVGLDTGGQPHNAGVFLVVMGVALFALKAIQEWLGGPNRNATRTRKRPGVIDTKRMTLVLLLVILLPTNAAMVVPSGNYEVAFDGDANAENEEYVPGEPATWQYTYTNYGIMPLAFQFETSSEAVTVPDAPRILWGNSDATTEVTMEVPPPGERSVAEVQEYRYLLVLPPFVIGALHDIHPFLGLLAVNLVLVIGTLLIIWRTLGFRQLRVRWGAFVGLRTRLRRRFD